LGRELREGQVDASHVLACRHCGTIQDRPGDHGVLDCAVCSVGLERFTGRSVDAALATSSAALLLLLPANGLVFLTTTLLGAAEHSHLISSATVLWRQGWPVLSIVIGLVTVVLPITRFALLTLVLGAVRFDWRPPWLGRVFRWSNELQTWAMADVFLLAFLVAYARLAATVTVIIGPGAVCFMAAGLLTLLSRATLDKKAVWRLIMAQPRLDIEAPTLSCEGCELLVPADQEHRPCPRCELKLESRKKNAIARAAAFSLGAIIFYAPANILPIATIPINLNPTAYNIIGGVHDLLDSHLYGLALLVFLASFLIPIAKLAAMAWFIYSVRAHSRKKLRLKTRLFQLIDEIGRWSMVDPLVIASFVPVVHFNTLLSARADAAAPFFTGVVVLTILAAKSFDPRLMWDVAETAP
jgi:paraquat-inducible protein A